MATLASAVRGTRLPVITRYLVTGALLVACPVLLATCRADHLLKPSATTLTLLGDTVAVADSIQLTAVVHVDGVVQSGLPLAWTSSADGIATVDGQGLVRGVARGRAVITVRLRSAAAPGGAAPAADTAWVIVPAVRVAPADTLVASVGDTVCLRTAALNARGDTIAGLVPAFTVTVDPDSTVSLLPTGPGCTGTRVRARRGGARATITVRLDTATASAGITVAVRAAGIVVSPDSLRLSSLGATRQLRDSAFDARGNPIGTPGTQWTSADTLVAVVSASGLVTARTNGATWIRARADTAQDSARVVVQQLARALVVTPSADSLRTVGAQRTLHAAVSDSLGVPIANAPLVWTNGAPDTAAIVAAAGDSAVVEAVREGRASLEASSAAGGGAAADTAVLTVRYLLRALTISPKQPKFSRLGDTLRFTAAAQDTNGTPIANPRVRWTSSVPGRVSIDSVTGLATARDSGTSLVRAEQSGISDTTTAQVLPPVLTADVTLFSDSALHGTSDTRSTTRAVSNPGTVGTGVKANLARGATWLGVTPDTFDLPPAGGASILLTASAAGLAEGVHVDTVILTAAGAVGSPRRIPVVFRVICPVAAIAPDTVVAEALAASDCRSPRRPGGQSFADLYAFTGGSGDTIRVTLTTGAQTDLDTYLYLLDSTGAVVAFNDDCPGAGRNSCLTGVPLPGPGRYTVEATSFGPAVSFAYTLTLTRPVAPGAASGLGQFRPGGPAIPAGGTTSNTTTEFRATGSDANARDTLRLQVEVRPFGTAFTGVPTATGASVPNAGGGVLLTVSVSQLSDGVSYHWRARVIDQTGRAGPWTAFGSGASADFTVNITGPVLTVTPTAALDSALQGAAGLRTVNLQIANTGSGSLSWTAVEQADSAWLTISPPSGTAPSILTVDLSTVGRLAGTYRDTIVIDVPGGATGAPTKIPVTFVIQRPVLVVTPAAVSRASNAGSGASFADTLRISNTGSGTLGWTAAPALSSPWLTLGKAAGGAPDDIPLTTASAGLAPGIYDDTVIVTANAPGADGSPARIPVRLTVSQPVLGVTPATVLDSANFGATTLRTAVVRITNADGGTLTWTAARAQGSPWLGVSKSAGGAPPADSVILSLNPSGLVAGVYRDTIVFTSPEANNDPLSVPVRFDILEHDPAGPGSPGQFRANGTTPIGVGASIDDKSVVFKATLTDVDPGDTLQLQVEMRPVGTAFSNVPTATSGFVANGAGAAISLAGLSDDVAYRWQARTVDGTGRMSGWLAFGGNHPDSADFRVAVPQDPLAPASLAQRKSNGTTPIGIGATTDEQTVVFQATVSDPDPGDSVRLQVERQPSLTPFANTPTATAQSAAAIGGTSVVVIGLQGDNTASHWQARVIDQLGRTGPWVSFGGNPEDSADYRIAVPEDPAASDSGQFKTNGSTAIAKGDTTDESTVVFKAIVTDPDPGDQLRLQIERRVATAPFQNQPTDSSAQVANGTRATVTVVGLADDEDYHWQYRACDQTGRCGSWTGFGGNIDFRVEVPQDPTAPNAPGQFQSDGTTAIGVGATSDQTTVVFKATVSDPDLTDQVRLQLEVRRLGEAVTGIPTHQGALVPRGTTPSVSVTGLQEDSSYRWRARTADQTGRVSAWVSFPQPTPNPDTQADFSINAMLSAPDVPTALSQFRADSTTPIPVGGGSGGSSVVLKGTISDRDPGDQVMLQVEVRTVPLLGNNFTNAPTDSSPLGASGRVASATGPAVLLTSYHWQARACDQTGRCSAWVSFGGNVETQADYAHSLAAGAALNDGR